jgi:hypothetical protein
VEDGLQPAAGATEPNAASADLGGGGPLLGGHRYGEAQGQTGAHVGQQRLSGKLWAQIVWPVPSRLWDDLDDPFPPSKGALLEHRAAADLREQYRRLMSSTQWLSAGMCWTAIVPDQGRAITPDQIAARLAGNAPYQLHEPAPLDAIGPPERDAYPVLIDHLSLRVGLPRGKPRRAPAAQ